MEVEKRKREEDGGDNVEKGKTREEDGGAKRVEVATAPPGDEEVDEFFAILKRIQVAVRYFQRRDGELAARPPWNPSFERQDFAGDEGSLNGGLDLNSDPAPEVPDPV